MQTLFSNHPEVYHLISLALAEDIGDGDHSSLSCISQSSTATARLLVKEDGILAGISLAGIIFNQVDEKLEFHPMALDGEKIAKGQILFTVKGKTHSILKAERLVLNFMQRLSGIATTTGNYVNEIAGTSARLLDTRKTTPGLRVLEKWAVKTGGGFNHRIGLYDMIMLKDNHVDAAGGIVSAIEKANLYRRSNRPEMKIEIETRNLKEVMEVLSYGQVDRIMLDNFSTEELKKAVLAINGSFETEASGGITIQNIREYALTGVDFISVGALTHSVKALDLSLKIVKS